MRREAKEKQSIQENIAHEKETARLEILKAKEEAAKRGRAKSDLSRLKG